MKEQKMHAYWQWIKHKFMIKIINQTGSRRNKYKQTIPQRLTVTENESIKNPCTGLVVIQMSILTWNDLYLYCWYLTKNVTVVCVCKVIDAVYNYFLSIKKSSKKDRQHNVQKRKDKRTNNDLQNIHIKLKIE